MTKYLDMLERFSPSPACVVILDDNCSDDTLEQIDRRGIPGLVIVPYRDMKPAVPRDQPIERSGRLAQIRNAAIDAAMRLDWDTALMQDVSKRTPPETYRELIAEPADVAAPLIVYGHDQTVFYDTWCFRDLAGEPFGHGTAMYPWHQRRFPNPTGVLVAQADSSRSASTDCAKRVEVQSVGGVYKVSRQVFEAGCRLQSTDGRSCDSVPFCLEARNKGFKIVVRTDLAAYAWPATMT